MNKTTKDSNSSKSYTITQLCKEFDVTPRTLRFYEQRKLLAPNRCGETRVFSYRDRARLQLILRGKQFGFTLAEIKDFLDLYQSDGDNTWQLSTALPKLQRQLERLHRERLELDEAITDLERSCDEVAESLNH
ncbi:MAG: MerR family DNA-binding transcriptional regulator [Rhizobiales bacterium]|nr:MerR family DNA-binding transcriptional regulator [Hyphomicrobiales bacterium]